jgi:hypothetical protein
MALLYSVLESPAHPDFSRLYRQLGIDEVRLASMRKALARIKQQAPDIIVAEFFYGFGNNYAGVNISNLDVMLFSLQKYAPRARVVVMVDKAERQYVDKLNDIFPLAAVLLHPVTPARMQSTLEDLGC